MHKPVVSVVMATHGRPAIARRAMESVLNQTYGAVELVVVADGPDSEKRRWVPALDERVVYDELPSWTGARGNFCRRRGIEIAKGEFLMILDDDDVFESDSALETVMEQLPFRVCVWSCRAPFGELGARNMVYAIRQGFQETFCSIQFLVPTATAKKVGWPRNLAVGSVPFFKGIYSAEFGDVFEPEGMKVVDKVLTLAYGAIHEGEQWHDYSPATQTDLG